MRSRLHLLRRLALLGSLLAGASAGKIQKDDLKVPDNYTQHRETVKQIFLDSYGVYKEHAWGHDEVRPRSRASEDPLGGWGASIVDSLSTMLIMNLTDLYTEGVEFVAKTDYSRSPSGGAISTFETTIRHIGGLLSAYELSGKNDRRFVDAAQVLGDKLAFAWSGDNVLPYPTIDFATNTPFTENNGPAGAGTLILEWSRLSEYTGNQTYIQLADRAFRAIANMNDTVLPGLPGASLRPKDASPDSKHITWGGGTDSYFEYLIKYARMTNNAEMLWVEQWKTAIESSLTSLAVRSDPKNWLMFADMTETRELDGVGSHLACFHGGNLIMGGRLLDNDTITQAGIELSEACFNTYTSTASGIGPESFRYVIAGSDKKPTNNLDPSTPQLDDAEFNNKHGFWVENGAYGMRPEVLESNFYAWRSTGDTKYLDNAVFAIEAFTKYLKVNETGGYAMLANVNRPEEGIIDNTPSFFFAETLKYLYLTFDDPKRWSLDELVFNTEAHPFLAPAALVSYDKPSDAPGNAPPSTGDTGAVQPTGTPGDSAWQTTAATSSWLSAALISFMLYV